MDFGSVTKAPPPHDLPFGGNAAKTTPEPHAFKYEQCMQGDVFRERSIDSEKEISKHLDVLSYHQQEAENARQCL